jgi:hypothetical protein
MGNFPRSKAPSCAGVTTRAHRKIVAAKSTLAVVARHTTERSSSSVMMKRLRRAYLTPARLDSMTLITVQPF